jgi:hypothetical protein
MQQVVLAMVDFKLNGVVVKIGKNSHFDVKNVDRLPHMDVVCPNLLDLVVLPLTLVFLLQWRQDVLELLQNLGTHWDLVVTHFL